MAKPDHDAEVMPSIVVASIAIVVALLLLLLPTAVLSLTVRLAWLHGVAQQASLSTCAACQQILHCIPLDIA